MINTSGRAKIFLGEVNTAAVCDPDGFFSRCNDKYENQIEEVCQQIKKRPEAARVIMLSGPSSSAKTTTSLKLRRRLEESGVHAGAISMDDFFRNRNDAPQRADGSRDFESPQALDIPLLTQALSDLILRGAAKLPVFDFKRGMRAEKWRDLRLSPGDVTIVEGLHALDPLITNALPAGHCLKLYISVSSDFIDDRGEPALKANSVRLIRRTIRDKKYRNSSPENTLEMWDDVCRGENLYVRPFKKLADRTINSVFACEPCLFRDAALRLFGAVPKENRFFPRARQLCDALSRFEAMDPKKMPGTCVLREFTGESVYYK